MFLLVAIDKNELVGNVCLLFFNFEKTKNLTSGFFHMLCFDAKGAVARVVFTYFSIKASLGDYVKFM